MEMEKSVNNRLNKIEGQIRGILKMVEGERPCKDILIQLLAVRSALEGVISLFLRDYLKRCKETSSSKDIDDILDLLLKCLPWEESYEKEG
jgi:DNA-binding FrmR family transcriptional regulator